VPLTRLRPDIPRDLETICLKCLEKQPNRRYPGAGALAEDLERFLNDQPVIALPLTAAERLARLAERDGYQIVAEIGRGPQSIVYHALEGPLQQPTALKVFPGAPCTREQWESRLRHAAEMWASLTHPQVVPVHRAGWWDGIPYLALEYVPQGSLADRFTVAPQPVRQTLRLLERLTEIVTYLHRQGVIHGNLKPRNILLAADGIPRVVDFRPTGSLFQGGLPSEREETNGLGYLAPEVIADLAADLRPHTDIYGLGLILYEMLTGRPAFTGSSPSEVLEQVRSRPPVSPAQLNPEVTPPLEAFCLRCLEKNPWRRYHRAFDLLRLLRHFQENPESRVPPPGWSRRLSPRP
jgi:serine/threonine protein kinase